MFTRLRGALAPLLVALSTTLPGTSNAGEAPEACRWGAEGREKSSVVSSRSGAHAQPGHCCLVPPSLSWTSEAEEPAPKTNVIAESFAIAAAGEQQGSAGVTAGGSGSRCGNGDK